MGMIPFQIDSMKPEDWPQVQRVYQEGIATGNATFDANSPQWEAWDAHHLKACRLVARGESEVLGWAAVSPVSSRCVYGGVGEASIYVGQGHRGSGVGSALLQALVSASEKEGLWTLQAGVFPENEASLRLLRRNGFRVVGVRERLGKMNGRWRDVVLLERRSSVAGTD